MKPSVLTALAVGKNIDLNVNQLIKDYEHLQDYGYIIIIIAPNINRLFPYSVIILVLCNKSQRASNLIEYYSVYLTWYRSSFDPKQISLSISLPTSWAKFFFFIYVINLFTKSNALRPSSATLSVVAGIPSAVASTWRA